MLNNKDDEKYEAPDESEYHFSDEEHYEAEPEHTETVSEPKASPMSSLKDRLLGSQSSPSKRMAISLVVFIGLVFVVYKIVAPTSTAVMEVEPTPSTAMTANPMTPAVKPAPAPTVAVTPPAPAAPAPAATAPTPAMAANPAPQPAAQPPLLEAIVQAVQPAAPANPAMAAQNNPLPGAPDVIAVETPATNAVMNAPTETVAVIPEVQQAQNVTATDVKIAEMQANSTKLISQMQADYAQKIAEFQGQNKILQDEVTSLNNKIGVIESQMAQLVQALTRQAQQQAPTLAPPKPIPNEPEGAEPQASNEQHVAYNVQAIIPGRAWLRSDNGDTITVAEGDSVKSLGRVTKIDPYDGVVEINTGHKVIALSYGTGA